MVDKTWIRITRKRQADPSMKRAGRHAIEKVEVVHDGEVVGLLSGVADLQTAYPLDGVVSVTLVVVTFEEVLVEDEVTP